MTVSIFFVWVTDGEVEKKFPNGMFYTFRESYSVNSLLKSLNCTDSTGGWVKSWIEKVVDMHEASGGWGGGWGVGVSVCTCVSIDPSLWWLDAGGVLGCLHHYWAVRHKAGGNKKIYQCNRNPREDYGINKKRMNNHALSPQTALSRVAHVYM